MFLDLIILIFLPDLNAPTPLCFADFATHADFFPTAGTVRPILWEAASARAHPRFRCTYVFVCALHVLVVRPTIVTLHLNVRPRALSMERFYFCLSVGFLSRVLSSRKCYTHSVQPYTEHNRIHTHTPENSVPHESYACEIARAVFVVRVAQQWLTIIISAAWNDHQHDPRGRTASQPNNTI